MNRVVLVMLLLFSTSAMAAWHPAAPGVPASPGKGGFSVQAPVGWNVEDGPTLVVATRNGIFLDCLRVMLIPHKNAFKALKKSSSVDAFPEDLAESYVANLQASGYREVELIATEPAELAGRAAFRVHLLYRLPEGLGGARVELVAVGAAVESGLLLATFEAPRIHYFEQSLAVTEEAMRTVVLTAAR